MHIRALDHVAVWTSERDSLESVLTGCCGMHRIEQTEEFTLVGADARRGKLTLFDAEGVRERGVLERVVLRVPDLTEARARLVESGLEVSQDDPSGTLSLDGPSDLPLSLVEAGEDGIADLDSVVLRVRDARAAADELVSLGLERAGCGVRVADKRLALHDGGMPERDRPLLHHLAFLVDEVDGIEKEARDRGLEIDRIVDAENTRAIFLWGPDRIKLEYVEHKPGFSLV